MEFATEAKPLYQLTAKGADWNWDKTVQQPFLIMKIGLTEASALGYPDPNKTYILDTDASDVRMGEVLSQIPDLAQPQKDYCLTGKELLAVVKAVKHFRTYLYGQHF